jgi:signal transduction histidine kinase
MAAEVIDNILPEARCAEVTLELEPGEETYTIFDEERMKQLLTNLVRNALEAVSQGGRIRVRTRLEPACAVLEVEDDGFGLPHPSAPIFEPFYTTKEQAIGLGLAIVQRIVNEHGGDIRAQSLPGSTQFVVRLPRMPQLGHTPSPLQEARR